MLIKQSESAAARRTVYFTAVNTADDSAHTSTLSGADIRVSKAGGSESNSSGTATHIATGLFKYVLTADECDTLGEVSIRLAKAGVYNDVRVVNIVAFDPYTGSDLGLTNLDAPMSSRLASNDYQNIAAMLAEPDTIENGVSLRGFLRALGAVQGGKTAGAGTGTEYFRALIADHKVRVTATVVGKNRTAIVFDLD